MHFVVIAKGSVWAVAPLFKHERVAGIEPLDMCADKFLESANFDPLMRRRETVRAEKENICVFVMMPVVGFVGRVRHVGLHGGNVDAMTISRIVHFTNVI
jgi:hypothetical protein